jgi:hypothetical protein
MHKTKFTDGRMALQFEQMLLDIDQIRYHKISGMDGGTELFRIDPLIYAIDILGYDIELE